MKLISALLLFAILTSGCGGGGGGSTPLPSAAVAARTTSWRSAQAAEDLDRVMAHYSASFVGDQGGTLEGVREAAQEMYATFDILRIDPLSETHTVAPSGEVVITQGDWQYTLRSRASGEQGQMRLQGYLEWGREGSTWRIIHSELIEAGA